MSQSYLQSTPSPIGQYKADLFETYSSSDSESYTSYSEVFSGTPRQLVEKIKLPPRLSSTCNHQRSFERQALSHVQCNRLDNVESNTSFCDDTSQTANLSVWEEWLMTKLQQEREKSKLKKVEMKKAKEEEMKKEKEKQRSMLEAEERNKKWMEEKLLQMKLRRSTEMREKKIKKEIEQELKEKIKTEAELKFKQWKEKHEELDQIKRLKEKEEKENEAKSKKEKEKLAEEKYQEWVEKNKHRFADLKKSMASPSPAFVNPNPWIGPNQDASRRRPNSPPLHPASAEVPQRFRTKTFSANRCSTPKRQARGLGTHTPMRTGSTHERVGAPRAPGFIRTNTPLRFAGIRAKTQSRPPKCTEAISSQRTKHKNGVSVPQPLYGMRHSISRDPALYRSR